MLKSSKLLPLFCVSCIVSLAGTVPAAAAPQSAELRSPEASATRRDEESF